MPCLIRTIDDIFRAEQRDLYVIRFEQADILSLSSEPPGQSEILDWFASNLPDTHVEPIGPPEGSGWIAGGIDGTLWVDFNAESLAVFCSAWENEEGASIDPRFQCYLYPIAMYEIKKRRDAPSF